jgi:hypothetical protein
VKAVERGHGSEDAWCGLRMVFGPLVEWMVEALEGAVVLGGLSALGARAVQHGYPRGQHCGVRDGTQGGQVPRHHT